MPPAADPAVRPRWRRALRRWLLLAAGTYLGIILVLVWFENALVFPATKADAYWVPPPSPDVQDVWLTAADGTRLHGWWLPRPGSADAVLILHGNGGNLSFCGYLQTKLRETLTAGVFIIDYPGYGKSEGVPTEAGCYRAADASYDWLVREQRVDPKRLVLFGESLGGGVATHLAADREHRALVLLKTYTRLPDVGAHLYPWLPARWLMRNRFDSVSRLPRCRRPVFVAHGTHDRLIPFALGQRLFEAANEPKEFFPMPGEDHNDPLKDEFYTRLAAFLRTHPLE